MNKILFALISLMVLIAVLLFIFHDLIPCTEPLFLKGCYVKNGKIQWCCD
jgi:uncharacterized protein YxeA